jgi:hypothetical protein
MSRALSFLQTRWGRAVCVMALVILYADNSDAATPAAEANDGAVWHTVSEARLDTLRGGFDTGGLLVSFGITRAVYVNGALLTETTLNLGQLSQLSPAQATQLGSQIAGLSLVRNGPGNTASLDSAMSSGIAGALPGVIVQNTLNNQSINVQTMINATSNGLGILRSMNSARTLTDPFR